MNMEKIEDWKFRFLAASCDLKHLLGELGGSLLPADMIYCTLDNCKQLLEIAIETICINRFKIHSVELVRTDATSSGPRSRTTLDQVLTSVWCSLQAGSLVFDFQDSEVTRTNESALENLTNALEDWSAVEMRNKDISDDVVVKLESETEETILDCYVRPSSGNGESVLDALPPSELIPVMTRLERVGTRRGSTKSFVSRSLPKNSHVSLSGSGPLDGERDESGRNCKASSVRKKKLNVPTEKPDEYVEEDEAEGINQSVEEAEDGSHTINFLSYKCFLCKPDECSFISFKKLARHVSTVHAIPDGYGGRVLQCSRRMQDNCMWAKSFSNVLDRDQIAYSLNHLVYNHDFPIPDFIEPFNCPYTDCQYQSVRRLNLDSHLRTHQPDLVACKDCGKVLRNKSMNLHRMFCEVVGVKVQPNICPVEGCGRSFKSKYSMVSHIKANHENLKTFPCPICKKTFANKTDFSAHMYSRHATNVTGRSAYSCSVCNFTCLTKNRMRKHDASVHPKVWNGVAQKGPGKGRGGTRYDELRELEQVAVDALEIHFSNLQNDENGDRSKGEEKERGDAGELKDAEETALAAAAAAALDLPQSSFLGMQMEEFVSSISHEAALMVMKEAGDFRNLTAIQLEDISVKLEEGEICVKETEMQAEEQDLCHVSEDDQSLIDDVTESPETSTTTPSKPNYASDSATEEYGDDDDDEDETETSSNSKNASYTLNFLRIQCFLCTSSDVVYQSISVLFDHIRRTHVIRDDEDLQALECPQCHVKKSVKRDGSISRDLLARLLSHMVLKHKWNVPDFVSPYYCSHPGCGFFSIQRRSLIAHGRRHVETEKVPCEKCGKLLAPRSFRQHTALCMIDVEKRSSHGCKICDKVFTSKQGLENHVKFKHQHIRNFLCSYCTKCFGTLRELEEHAFHQHKVNMFNRPVLTCPLCCFISIRRPRMDRHHKQVHVAFREHLCLVCDKRFKTTAQLKTHMRGHEEKGFVCQLCDFRTARKTNLREHIEAQHLGKLFRCEFCGYTTGYLANLHKHMRITCRKKQNMSVDSD